MPVDDDLCAADYDDPSEVAHKASKRIEELKDDRDKRVNATIAETEAALEDLRSRVIAHQEERRIKKADEAAACLSKIHQGLERRMEIEKEMEEIVVNMHSRITEVGELMQMGYRGRKRDARRAKKARENQGRLGNLKE